MAQFTLTDKPENTVILLFIERDPNISVVPSEWRVVGDMPLRLENVKAGKAEAEAKEEVGVNVFYIERPTEGLAVELPENAKQGWKVVIHPKLP